MFGLLEMEKIIGCFGFCVCLGLWTVKVTKASNNEEMLKFGHFRIRPDSCVVILNNVNSRLK